jgi:hypothetical protein
MKGTVPNVPLRATHVNVNADAAQLRRETKAHGIVHGLWSALDAAHDGGFDDLEEEIGRLYAKAIQRKLEVQERAV